MGQVFNFNRVRVKVCGLTCREDAEAAIDAGADALGFNTWVGSKRFVDVRAEAEWISSLPAFVSRVALCVNAEPEWIRELSGLSWVDAIQLHGDESREFCRQLAGGGVSVVRAVRVGSEADLDSLDAWGTSNILLDASVVGAFGGTGAAMDLRLACLARERYPGLRLTVAGGLDPENVGAVVRELRPYAVDVASGVEWAPGRKDVAKLRAFIQAVQTA
jgi:phosphoribosylanthranilate isomerase